MTEPLGTAKVVAAAVHTAHSVVDAATKQGGPVSRLLGLDQIATDFRAIKRELEQFTRLVESHHTKHEQATIAIARLFTEFKHLEDRISDRLAAAVRLADAKAEAQDHALRDFEARLKLLSDVLTERAARN